MSKEQKIVRIISIIVLIFGIINTALGLFLLISGALLIGEGDTTMVDVATGSTTLSAGATALGMNAIFNGFINGLMGIFGLRAAKDASKVTPFWIFSIIGLALGAFVLINGVLSGLLNIDQLINVCLMLACVILANRIRNQAI